MIPALTVTDLELNAEYEAARSAYRDPNFCFLCDDCAELADDEDAG